MLDRKCASVLKSQTCYWPRIYNTPTSGIFGELKPSLGLGDGI